MSHTEQCIHNKHNYLATVAPGQHDEYSSRCDGRAQFPPVLAEGLDPMAAQLPRHILRWVVTWLKKGKGGKK